MFGLQNQVESNDTGDSGMTGRADVDYEFIGRVSRFDMALTGIETGSRIRFNWEYCTGLFRKETIGKFIGYFKDIIKIVSENRDIPLDAIQISHTLSEIKTEMPRIDFQF